MAVKLTLYLIKMSKIFTQIRLGSKINVFIKNIWEMKCLVAIHESLYKM